jgi:lysozyme family protein
MKDNFPACLEVVLHHEGGWSDHKDDPGGATMKGVTLATFSNFLGRPATKDELRNISDEQINAIYHRNYWGRVAGDRLSSGLDLSVFDMAVNAGVSRSVRMLQEIVGSTPDGVLGPRTLAAVAEQDTLSLIRQYAEERRRFYKSLKTFDVFGRGWLRRVDEVEAKAKDMVESFT